MTPLLLGEVKQLAKQADVLGLVEDSEVISWIRRALSMMEFKANWDLYSGIVDVCVGNDRCVVLPYDVGVVEAVNVGGRPTLFRNGWYEFNINGYGSTAGQPCAFNDWGMTGVSDDKGWAAAYQQPSGWSYLAALVEKPEDGPQDNSKFITVWGITVDANNNEKEVEFRVPMVYGSPYPNTTYQIKRVTRVVKPVTAGYVKLIAFSGVQGAEGDTIGYYSPHETQPRYRVIQVGQKCTWVRIRYQRKSIRLIDDLDIVPAPHGEAIVSMIKSVLLAQRGDASNSEWHDARATKMCIDYQSKINPQVMYPQFGPGFGVGLVDWR